MKKCAYLFPAERNDNEVVVEQAVPIGTKLQLRASINTDSGTDMIALCNHHSKLTACLFLFSAWKYVKLLEVTMSPDPQDMYGKGHIKLVTNG